MITVDLVKSWLVERLEADPTLYGVNIHRHPPLSAADLTKRAGDTDKAVWFDTSDSTLEISAVCGDGSVEYDEEATVGVVCQTLSRTSSVTAAVLDAELAAMTRGVLKAVSADPTGGVAPGTNADIPRLQVEAAGWDQTEYMIDGENRLGARLTITVAVTATLTIT